MDIRLAAYDFEENEVYAISWANRMYHCVCSRDRLIVRGNIDITEEVGSATEDNNIYVLKVPLFFDEVWYLGDLYRYYDKEVKWIMLQRQSDDTDLLIVYKKHYGRTGVVEFPLPCGVFGKLEYGRTYNMRDLGFEKWYQW